MAKITGTIDDDVLNGTASDDTLYGGGGADTYIYIQGDGHDIIINDSLDTEGSIDILEFKDIKSTDIEFKWENYDDLVISLLDNSGSVTIDNFFIDIRMIVRSMTGLIRQQQLTHCLPLKRSGFQMGLVIILHNP